MTAMGAAQQIGRVVRKHPRSPAGPERRISTAEALRPLGKPRHGRRKRIYARSGAAPEDEHTMTLISTMPFGNTQHSSSRALLGAAAFGQVTQDEADAAIALALSSGVNHIDTAASYGDSEVRIGSWIKRHGQGFFLATKTGERE